MAIIRWNPTREIDSLQREMNRLFDRVMPSHFDWDANAPFVPAAEMSETPEAVHLKLEVPGMKPDDLDVQVSADSVSIRGERRDETQTEEKGMTRTEFRYGSFERVIPLPVRVENTQATAEYKDGILTRDLPKIAEEQHKVVKVNLS